MAWRLATLARHLHPALLHGAVLRLARRPLGFIKIVNSSYGRQPDTCLRTALPGTGQASTAPGQLPAGHRDLPSLPDSRGSRSRLTHRTAVAGLAAPVVAAVAPPRLCQDDPEASDAWRSLWLTIETQAAVLRKTLDFAVNPVGGFFVVG